MSNNSPVLLDVVDHVATITLNTPENYNTLVPDVQKAIQECVVKVNADPSIWVVVLTGAGKAFSAGGNVKVMKQKLDSGYTFQQFYEAYIEECGKTTIAFSQIKAPVIAKINGACVGAGCSMAMMCDYRISVNKAKFGFPFTQRGLIPDYGTTLTLPRIVGMSRAMELITTGRIFGADEAYSYGIVNELVAPEELDARVAELCKQICSSSPYANRKAKELMYNAQKLNLSLEDTIAAEGLGQAYAKVSPDHREGVESFLDKRPADFSKLY